LCSRARASQGPSNDECAETQHRLTNVEKALARLTAAVAAGGDVPALVDAIKVQDGQRRALERRLEALQRPPVAFDRVLERRLRAAVDEWRDVLGRQVAQARQIVTKLLQNRLTFTPEKRDGHCVFRFQAIGSVAKLIAGGRTE
jgi:lipopolysaccharide biosynthesis regulator YciM